MTCTLQIGGINGEAVTGAGLPTRLRVYVRRQGNCDQVEITVRVTQNGQALFSATAQPDSNGTASAEFMVEPPVFACGALLWVEARCVDGNTCSATAPVAIDCKGIPGAGPGGGPGGPGGPGEDDWPWSLPPELFCPLIGRAFTSALMTGIVATLVGIAMSQAAVAGVGIAIVAAAFGILAVWRRWCSLPYCYFWGAILWVLKRCLLAGAILTLVFVSVATLLCTLVLGVAAGIVTNRLRKAHCPLPSLTTPLTQLPFW